MTSANCPCGTSKTLDDCCERWHAGAPAPSAEALMRSRYSAYCLGLIDYLLATTLPAQQAGLDRDSIAAWSAGSQWLGLEVHSQEASASDPAHAFVTFTAHWRDAAGEHAQHERSAFVHANGRWYFLDPTVALKLGRNDPCPCGNGGKFKKCCSAYLP